MTPGVCVCACVMCACVSDAPFFHLSSWMLFYYEPRNEFDIQKAIIPYVEQKVIKHNVKPRFSSNITPTTSSCGELNRLGASQKALARAKKIRKREENTFFQTYGYNQSLNERVENNKSRRIDSRLGDDKTRVQQQEKVLQFLKDCSVEDDEGSDIFQWKPEYMNDHMSYYLLNALDTAVRKAGDLTTALMNAVDCYSAQRLLPVIYETFKESKYKFVEVDETQKAFVDRFTHKGISAKQVFNSEFSSYLLKKISS